MALAPGTRLGSYEIAASIGAGGMGEVYRARDTKLNRDVAIKVLPERLGADAEALSRFEREAQAVAALSHPNILAMHDFGSQNGVTYAVMELLDGESLRAKLDQGALPPRKAIDYALQIVHGIAAAHQKGVVHRDLKPENIFITGEGRVKILDFGLAKTTGPAGGGSMMQTRSGLGTSPGTVMGTVGYMSPEQVRGLPVDHRTDIFSFGVVFYEMLSGRRAFHGDSNVETMNAILKEDPPDLAVSGTQVPPALDRIVRRCLEKNPAERFHSAHDLGLALETLSAMGGSVASGAAIALPKRRTWLPFAAAVAVAVVAYAAGSYFSRPQATGSPTYQRLTYRLGKIVTARLTGDGKTAVYSAAFGDEPKKLYSTSEGGPDSLALAYPNADVASVSRSGELALILDRHTVRGYAQVGTLARGSSTGNAARAVLEDVQDADWLPDGSGFAAAHYLDGRYRLEFPIGTPVYETTGYISDVRISPDGSKVAFVDHLIQGDDRGSIAVVDRAGKKRAVSEDYSSAQGLAWAADGREIWYTAADQGNAKALFATTVDGHSRVVVRVPGNVHLADVGSDGSVLFWKETTRSVVRGRGPGDTADRELSWLDYTTVPKLSNDGKWLAFTEEGDGGGVEYSVYVRSTDGGPAVRLGPGCGLWFSPDGKWVLSMRINPAPSQLVLLPVGAGEAKQVTHDELTHELAAFTEDGKSILFEGFAPGRPKRLYLQDLAGGAARAITPEGVLGALSPDGKLVAFDGKLYEAGGTASRPIPGFEAGQRIERWAPDGKSVIVRSILPSGGQHIYRLDTTTGARTLLYDVPPVSTTLPGAWFTITPDGSAYFTSYNFTQGDLFRATGLR
ncbi:MAG TPA: protein kinase [Candidatus Polarisedimenticolaceae bacterium]|nr:protein kinase [Candidatus Polarisedimenticolaceae bacterium]